MIFWGLFTHHTQLNGTWIAPPDIIQRLDASTFAAATATNISLVMFYNKGCMACKQIAIRMEQVGEAILAARPFEAGPLPHLHVLPFSHPTSSSIHFIHSPR